MAKRASRRLGIGGEMVPPGPNLQGQWLFLDAVRRLVAEALTALAAIAPDLPDDPFNRDNKGQEAPLRAWCERWGFTEDWLLTVARNIALLMRCNPSRAPTEFEVDEVFEPSYQNLKTEIVAPTGWVLATETEAQYDERVAAYKDSKKAEAAEQGWSNAREKRTLIHFDWLALYQVGGLTEAKISERYQDTEGRPNVPAVSQAITNTAERIGLHLRPAQGRDRAP